MEENKNCFVIMPISDPVGYEKGHFKCVYEDIFKPAIEEAGFIPKRADEDNSSSMIQVNIIKDIIEAPMAICDLSTRNPNVLFELGIRQAFDLPVVLVQEKDTPRIFDISTINTIDYQKDLFYRNVLEDRKTIAEAIQATKDNSEGINSIIRLLEIGSAELKEKKEHSDIDDIRFMLITLSNQINEINREREIWEERKNSENRRTRLARYASRYRQLERDIQIAENRKEKERISRRLMVLLKEIATDDSLSVESQEDLIKRGQTLIEELKNLGDDIS